MRNRTRVNIGEERYVVSMFVDMRGSTKLAEARLPFDVVFLINRFLEAASQAVVDAGGQPNRNPWEMACWLFSGSMWTRQLRAGKHYAPLPWWHQTSNI